MGTGYCGNNSASQNSQGNQYTLHHLQQLATWGGKGFFGITLTAARRFFYHSNINDTMLFGVRRSKKSHNHRLL